MNRNIIWIVIGLVILAIIGFFVFNQNDANRTASDINITDTDSNTEDNTNTDTTPQTSTTTPNQPTNEPTVPDGNDIAVFEIVYDGNAFKPSQLTIKNGDVVIFKNESSESFWPASGPHPEHTNYPEFDPKKSIAPGQEWQFKFTKSGEWPYHNHLKASVFGKIVVQ